MSKKINRCYRWVSRHLGSRYMWDGEELKGAPRKVKKFFIGTKRKRQRDKLREMRLREHCKHENWDTKWSPIAGEEWRDEPDYDFCVDCGISEMELDAKRGNSFWRRHYPPKQRNTRWRAIDRLQNLRWLSEERAYR